MTIGKLAIVLHAHLPYVRSAEPGSLEEDWFFQAVMESYLPLLKILEAASSSKEQSPKITIGLSPTLLSLLENNQLRKRFPSWIKQRIDLLTDISDSNQPATNHLRNNLENQLNDWEGCKGHLIRRFQKLQHKEVVDILTCAATHGYLPLLRESPEAVRGQFKTAVREHRRIFGTQPLGIWLPECAYYEGLDKLMAEAGLRYAVLDGHGLLNAIPRPRYGLYAPICSKNGVAFFGRDSRSTLPVWSAKQGYPGDPVYREFHRDLGWDIPIEKIKITGVKENRPLGLKLHKVTGLNTPLKEKCFYEPKVALNQVKNHAREYLKGRKNQFIELTKTMGKKPILIAPFDAELFGHWWFEGPDFLGELFKLSKSEGIEFTSLNDVLSSTSQIQRCEPSPSSWGMGGYHNYWLNETNAWVVNEWNKASKAMIKISTQGLTRENDIRVLQQAGRELLLSQSSDWSFILRAGTTTEIAKERISLHLERFWMLINSIDNREEIKEGCLKKIEKEDSIFPLIQASDWKKVQPSSSYL